MHNRNDWGLWIPLALIPICLAAFLICIAWGVSRIALSYSQPAPATSTPYVPIPEYISSQMIVNASATVFGSQLTAHYAILYVDSTDKVIRSVPTSTDTESGQDYDSAPQVAPTGTWNAVIQSWGGVIGATSTVVSIPATTSTEWSCPTSEFFGPGNPSTLTVTFGGTSTPESEGFSDCTQIATD